MARRTNENPSFQHAVREAEQRGVGVWMLEVVRSDYPHASDRFHAFIQQGMADNEAACKSMGVGYHAHVETKAGDTKMMLQAVSKTASLIVTDDHPGFFIPRMLAAVHVDCPVVAVDGNGLLPLSATPRTYPAAVHFRRHVQKSLPDHWWFPDRDVDADGADVPEELVTRWPHNPQEKLDALPIDHSVAAVETRGGSRAASDCLDGFDVDGYGDANHPDAHATSGLSPYLHFGHIGTHQVVRTILDAADWSPNWGPANGARAGWWKAPEPVEAFLDQIVTWRELGFVDQHHRPDNSSFESLPDWAKETLGVHAKDPRERLPMDVLESAQTDDEVWNAAQRQLLQEGVIHNYLRMVWGKRFLEWSRDAEEAFQRMLHLNDKWALDGRDPNSVSGIAWVLGRFDRAWGERDVFGKVRYMSSANTVRKLRMRGYLERFSS